MGKNVNVQTSMGIIISVSDNFQIFQFKLRIITDFRIFIEITNYWFNWYKNVMKYL